MASTSSSSLPMLTEANIKAVTATWVVTEADKQFMPKDKSTSPFPNTQAIALGQGALYALSVLAFLLGPEGIILSAGLSFGATLLGLPSGSSDTFANMVKTLEEHQTDENLFKLLVELREFATWCKDNADRFMALDKFEAQFRLDFANGSENSLILHESPWYKKNIIDHLTDLINDQKSPLGTCVQQLGVVAENPPWNRSDIRLACLHAQSWLLISYKLLILAYARLAKGAEIRNDNSERLDNISAVYNTITNMRKKIVTYQEAARAKIKKLSEARKAQVSELSTGAEIEQKINGNENKRYYTSFTDACTGGKHRTHCDNKVLEWPWDNDDSMITNKHIPEATKSRQEYLSGLDAHIARVFAPENQIVDGWSRMLSEIDTILKPPRPRAPPVFRKTFHVSKNPSPFLKDALSVAYCYSIETDHGTSECGPWTDAIPLEGGNIPELFFSGAGSPSPPRIHIYHRVVRPEGAKEPLEAKAGVLESVSAETPWADEPASHLPHGRA